ncbi:discoidin domain-containing protein [Gorillibacterium massiliense]|uniref:discoidin domain-containing protein n=1 Tax=Gorillibacterium massiliense TaxID=1280390 RepID=UPI0004B6D200|nr:discoidin domain-containing protein [Gorillibacterium massiliense]
MGKLWQKYRIAAIVVIVVLLLAVAGLAGSKYFTGSGVSMKKADGNLVVSNDHYDIAFNEKNGGISYIKQHGSADQITGSNREGALWWGILQDGTSIQAAKAEDFSYDWKRSKGELALHYKGQLQVDITIEFSKDNRIRMSVKTVNGSQGVMTGFRFPNEILLDSATVNDGLLPMLPGAMLKSAFFQENNSYEAQYPGIMFASYVAMRGANGNLSLYDVNERPMPYVDLGFKNQMNIAGKTGIVHNYKTDAAPGAVWKSPTVVMEVGGDYKDSIESYRTLNGMDKYRSLADKLGGTMKEYLQLPFYKLDISALTDANWSNLKTNVVDKLDYKGVLHLVGFQTGGHDENYPDFLPADSKWGSVDDFNSFMSYAKEKGNRVVPYTNFSWWGVNSPTLKNLPSGVTLEDIAVLKENGAVMKEDYGVHSGYVMNIQHPYVNERIADEHKKLTDAGMDGVFEDQWGIREVPFVYNKGVNKSTSYMEGVRDYFKASKMNLYTEDGFDVLADNAVGFMGTNYLWDILGYRANTASYTDYYPMIGMLARDKVMLYQHDLAAQTMTDDIDMLRFNLAMGYNLSVDLFNGTNNPWIDLAGVMQQYVLAPYGDARVNSYDSIAKNVTKTGFTGRSVVANWDKEKPYTVSDGFILPAGGVQVLTDDGSVRAGSYSTYNGQELDPGDHVLVEVRQDKEIKLFQPVGSDTTVKVAKGKDWPHATAAAYAVDGTKIADIPVEETGNNLRFDYIASILDKKTAYISLQRSDNASTVKDVPFHKVALKINIAVGKKVSASSMTTTDFPPEKTVDGDPYTYWESTAKKFPQTLTVDLGEAKKVTGIALKLPPQDAWESRDQIIEVSASTDGQTFTTIKAAEPYTFDPKKDNVVSIDFAETPAQYVRVTITGNTAWPAAQVSEFEVY